MKCIILFFTLSFCISCVQEIRDVTIHFRVDMNAVENVQSVGIIGEDQPLSWNSPTALTDLDKDGVYEGIITVKVAYNYSEFKFILNEEEIELEGKGNRIVRFGEEMQVAYSGKYDVLNSEEN